MSTQVVSGLTMVINVFIILIFIEVIIANFMAVRGGVSSYHPLVVLLRRIVNPVLNPIRRVLPPSKTGGWDFSPMVVMLALYLLRGFLNTMR